jgi:cytochrome c oxidase assembly protein subunit 11
MTQEMKSTEQQSKPARRDMAVALWCAVVVFAMVGASYAAVPLYRLFCQTTGFAGTPLRAKQASNKVVDKIVTIRFDANVAPGLPWKFEPVQSTVDVKIGENTLVFYRATNLSDQRITGSATFNVMPDTTGAYFNKIQCFCFTEQTLNPHESVEMPVSFYLDPAMLKDRDTQDTRDITLSYTFYAVPPKERPGVAEHAPAVTGKGS